MSEPAVNASQAKLLKGVTVWFTGPPSSGKSTVARLVERQCRKWNLQVELLDGDVVRTYLSKGLSFSKEDRDENIKRIGFVSHLLTRNGIMDVKGLYKKARAGEIKGMTGVDDPYEEPLNPEVTCETENEAPEESAAKVLQSLESFGYLEMSKT